MIAFLEKLTKRKTEVALKGATAWQQLVADVVDEKEGDPDAVLLELDRLGKSTDDLAKAVELLKQRRVWAREVSDGVTAEADLTATTEQIQKLETELAGLLERHEAKLAPVEARRLLAIQRISSADSARRRLVETAGDPLLVQAVRDADANMASLRKDRSQFEQKIRGLTINRDSILKQDDSELAGEAERLARGIQNLKGQAREFHEQAESLNAASEAAREQLLRPDAI